MKRHFFCSQHINFFEILFESVAKISSCMGSSFFGCTSFTNYYSSSFPTLGYRS